MKKFKLYLWIFLCFIGAGVPALTASAKYVTGVDAFSYEGWAIPAYDGDSFEVLNNNTPKFKDSQFTQTIYASYGKLDGLGRVTGAEGNIDYTLLPTEERSSISSIYPTGWVQAKYDFVSAKYLYNRSHLLMYALTGNNSKQNLMTGTRTFNATGMLTNENRVLDYVKKDNENNVLYRVTPVFQGDNLLASGVIMEAESVDDLGKALKFAVFVYNVEPGVAIDYETGASLDVTNLSTDTSGSSETGTTTSSVVSVEENGKDVTLRQTISMKAKKKKIKQPRSAKYIYKIGAKNDGPGKLTYKLIKKPKKAKKSVKVNKKGRLLVRKKARKGTYKIRVTAKKKVLTKDGITYTYKKSSCIFKLIIK